MAYIALYRKYRSQTFDDVIGQEHVTRTLQNAIKSERIGHAYLFCGSRGTGKTSVARLIAKAVNCVNGPTSEPCNKCEACLSITDGSAVDVIEMDAASNRGIDDVAAIRDNVKYPPMSLRYKIYIIDEAHQLSRDAKDAFLKTLEEPPAHAIFILATTEAHAIPPTIRSRCQQFDFRRGSLDDLAKRLKYVCESEGVKIDQEALDLLAKNAGGSWRDALSLLEQVLAYSEKEVSAKDVSSVLGSVDLEMLFEVGEVIASKDAARAFELADRMVAEGKDVRELLRSIIGHLRELLHAAVGVAVGGEYAERYKEQAKQFSRDRLIGLIETFAASEKEMRWNDQHRLVLELAMLKAVQEPSVQPRPVVQSSSQPAARPAQPVAPPVPAPAAASMPPAEPPVPIQPPSVADEPPVASVPYEEPPVETLVAPPEPEMFVPQPEPVMPQPTLKPVVEKPESPVEQPPVQMPAAEAVVSGNGLTIEEVRQNWSRVLGNLKATKNVSIQVWLRDGRPVSIEGGYLVIGFSDKFKFAKDKMEDSRVQQIIAAAVLAATGKHTKLRAKIMDQEEMQAVPADFAPDSSASAGDAPLVRDVLSIFGGEIVEEDQDNETWEDG